MKSNEKAVAAGTGQTAVEINQIQDKPDYGNCQEPVDPVIPELIAISNRLKELETSGILHYLQFKSYTGEPQVYLKEDAFFKLFSFGEYGPHECGVYDQASTTVDGVEFFCLVEKGGIVR
jgi:hypothetical protein